MPASFWTRLRIASKSSSVEALSIDRAERIGLGSIPTFERTCAPPVSSRLGRLPLLNESEKTSIVDQNEREKNAYRATDGVIEVKRQRWGHHPHSFWLCALKITGATSGDT
jgi:hypothetical protein